MARFTLPWSRREKFSSWSIGDPAFAAWIRGDEDGSSEPVNPYTVLGLSAVLRSVQVISTTIAALPLRTYERQGDERQRIPSVFDDPYPGIEGMTPFAWVETVLIHLLLWRNAYLWHESRDPRTGEITAYRPIPPDLITKVRMVNGRKVFTYRTNQRLDDPYSRIEDRSSIDPTQQEVGSDWITHIPGPSLDGAIGHPLLYAARSIFSGALSGDKAAALTLRRGIRLAGLVTPEDGEEVEPGDGDAILEQLRSKVVGREHAGDVAFINKHLKLQPWTPTNIDMQWAETRQMVLGEVGRFFGVPPHLLNDIEKQTSWGTGVAEQNMGFARYTLMGWSSRVEQGLSRRLPAEQFMEFDYKGLLQGTPAQEIATVGIELDKGIIDTDEARKILNLPPRPAAQPQPALRTVPPAVAAGG